MECHKKCQPEHICCDDRMFVDACPREDFHCGCWEDYDFDWGGCECPHENCCPPCEGTCCPRCAKGCTRQPEEEKSDMEDYESKGI